MELARPEFVQKPAASLYVSRTCEQNTQRLRIRGLVVEYIVAIDVTRVRFPADAQAKLATLVHEVTE